MQTKRFIKYVISSWMLCASFIILGWLLATPVAVAQLYMGIEAGASLNRINYKGYYYYQASGISTSTDILHRPAFGLKLEYAMADDMHIYSGLRFSQRGGSYNMRTYDMTTYEMHTEGPYRIEYDYLEIPIGAKVFLNEKPVRLYLGMNGVLAINTRAESIGPDTIEEPLVDYSSYARDVTPFVDLLLGLQFSLSDSFSLFAEGRYTRSILSIDENEYQNVYSNEIYFGAGVSFLLIRWH